MSLSRVVYAALFGFQLIASGQTPPPVPAAYQSLYTELQGDITSFQQAISTTGNGSSYPTIFAAQALTANSDQASGLLAPYYYTNAVMSDLQEMKALGNTAVAVHINFPILYEPFYGDQQTFQSYVTFYQQVAQQIRSLGMKMIVETTVASPDIGNNGGIYQPYYASLSWNDYMNGRAQQAVNVAQLIQPDFMSVITEPDSESMNSGQPNAGTPAGSLQELQTILAALQAANVRNVPVGAGAGTWITSFSTYIQNVISTPISYVDLHLYTVSPPMPENALTAATMAHAAGLPIAMSETWCKKLVDGNGGNLNNQSVDALGDFSFWEPLDQMFLQSLVNMSQAGQFLFISPFWSAQFYATLDYGQYGSQTTSQIILAEQTASGTARQAGSFTPLGPAWESMILPSPDTTAPQVTAPPAFGVVGLAIVQVLWNPTTDNVGVAGYNLYRNGTLINTSSQVNYNDQSVSPSTTYTYRIQAFDAAGNVSALSAPASVTTPAPPDNTPPTTPLNFKGTGVSDLQIQLTWSPSTDNVSVAGYRIYRGASANALSIFTSVPNASFTDTQVYPNGTYYYAVEAFDPSYNFSAPTPTIAVSALPDTTPPTVPANLVATGTGYQQVSLSWSASADDIRVSGYRIFRGKTTSSMVAIANSTTTSYVDTAGLMPGITYYYAVAAYDPAQNLSAQSAIATATTIPDTQPPTVPQNLAASATSGTQINLTWSPSSDNVGVYGYRIYRGTTSTKLNVIASSTVPSYTDTLNLRANQTYYYAVAASDASGNVSAESAIVSVVNP